MENHGDGEHQWGTSWLLRESWLPSQADRQVALVGLVRSKVPLEGLRWVGSSRGEQGMAGVLLPASRPPFSSAKPAAAYQMQMEKMQFVVSVR